MPASVVPFSARRQGTYVLLEAALPGRRQRPREDAERSAPARGLEADAGDAVGPPVEVVNRRPAEEPRQVREGAEHDLGALIRCDLRSCEERPRSGGRRR